MVSDKVLRLCRRADTITSELRKTPDTSPGSLASALYGSHHLKTIESRPPTERIAADTNQLDRASQCGRFGSGRPSDLFLRAWDDVLGTLDADPLAGICSPPLLGSSGVVPFTVIGPVNDILRHMANLIVRAEKEVLLATNYWMSSSASQLINDALLELSRRAAARSQTIPVKIMYDRGNPKQFLKNHQYASESELRSPQVQLPGQSDVPNLHLEVVNFHRPLLGTFHSKFMVVDRSIAITQSNNIQDNDNLEMMAQLEGPIVDGLWEAFVISWHNNIQPLACINDEASRSPPPTFQADTFTQLFNSEGLFRLPEQPPKDPHMPPHDPKQPHYDADLAGEVHRMHAMLHPVQGEDHVSAVARHLNLQTKLDVKPTAASPRENSLHFFPFIPLPKHEAVPIALVSRKPYGKPMHSSLHTPQNEAFLSLIRNAEHTVFIQTPDLNASPLFDAILAAVRRGVVLTYYVCLGYNDAGELLPLQNGTNEMFANRLYKALDQDPGSDDVSKVKDRLRIHYYVAKDQTRPIHNSLKQRSCHVKLLIADDQVAIQGSGNQDTQSWWQSQEVNIMVDSALICRAWREGIERNQNTGTVPLGAVAPNGNASTNPSDTRPNAAHTVDNASAPPPANAHGRSAGDGCWRDPGTGELAEHSLGTEPGRFAWAKGAVGAYRRARGAGGF